MRSIRFSARLLSGSITKKDSRSDSYEMGDKEHPYIIPHAREAFGVLKFYDTKEAGIEVAGSKKEVLVKKVLEGTPFARSGIKEGDQVLDINGTKIDNTDTFRRLVRRRAMASEEAVVIVDRPQKGKMKLTVELRD